MVFPYTLILITILVLSPFIIALSSRQDKKIKQRLKNIFLALLSSQILLGFLNWENFTVGRSGLTLSLEYPESILALFFIISALQILLLISSQSFKVLIVALNFINSVVIFIGMIKLSSFLGFQAISLSSIGAVILVLIGNVVALAYVNKDKK